MDPSKLMKWSAFAGFGLIAVGTFLYFSRRSGAAGAAPLSGPIFINERYPQADVVDSYSTGKMRTQLRASAGVEMPIQQRLATIQDLVHKSVQDPQMRKLALAITADCAERDGMCEAKAIYKAVKKRIRYTGDIAPIAQGANGPVDGIDLYQSARRTWQFKGGDCDDHSILISTLLALNGIEPRLRVTAEDPNGDWQHIYAGGMLPKTAPEKFVALDTTLPGYKFNFEMPYAKALDFPA